MKVSEEPSFGGEMFGEYIDWRIDHPSDDLMTELLHTEFEDETGTTRTLTRDEALLYTTVVAGAGNETTTRLIGWAGKFLAEYPDQRRELVADPSLIPNAVEELVRYEPPGPTIGRYMPGDVEVHGQTVPAGSAMLFVVGAANHDDRRFDGSRPLRHPPRDPPAPRVRVRHPLLPRRRARPPRRADRARGAPRPLPRVGRRPRTRAHRAHVDGPRLRDAPRAGALTTTPAPARRRYDSTLRRERAAADAGAHRRRRRRAPARLVDPRLARASRCAPSPNARA